MIILQTVVRQVQRDAAKVEAKSVGYRNLEEGPALFIHGSKGYDVSISLADLVQLNKAADEFARDKVKTTSGLREPAIIPENWREQYDA